jgi:hypothetical protein
MGALHAPNRTRPLNYEHLAWQGRAKLDNSSTRASQRSLWLSFATAPSRQQIGSDRQADLPRSPCPVSSCRGPLPPAAQHGWHIPSQRGWIGFSTPARAGLRRCKRRLAIRAKQNPVASTPLMGAGILPLNQHRVSYG